LVKNTGGLADSVVETVVAAVTLVASIGFIFGKKILGERCRKMLCERLIVGVRLRRNIKLCVKVW